MRMLLLLSTALMFCKSSLLAQSSFPQGMLETIAGGRWNESNPNLELDRLQLEKAQLELAGYYSLTDQVLLGGGVGLSFEPGLQFHRFHGHLRWYPLGVNQPFAMFGQLSPGVAWTRGSIFQGPTLPNEIYSDTWFHPRLSIGGTIRPKLGAAALEVRAEYQPGYEQGPALVHRFGRLQLRFGFSYWFGTSTVEQ